MKRQIFKGEILRDLTPSAPESNPLLDNLQIVNDILSQLIIKPGSQNAQEAEGGLIISSTRNNIEYHINTQQDIFSQIRFKKGNSQNGNDREKFYRDMNQGIGTPEIKNENQLMDDNFDE